MGVILSTRPPVAKSPPPAPMTSTPTPIEATATSTTTSTATSTATPTSKALDTSDIFEGTRPSGTSVAETAGASSVGFQPIVKRRLPALREALVDPTVLALALSSLSPPPAVTTSLATAKRILVIGHANPADGDCVGSALALKRGLEALGKDVVAVVDQALPRSLRAIDDKTEIRRADSADVIAGGFDVVVLVDVAQADRTGAMADIIKAAKNIVVLDHHDEPHLKAARGVADDAVVESWVDVGFDAAAVQVGAAVIDVARAIGADAAAVEGATATVADAVAAGLYTDTLGFSAPGAAMTSLQLFKGLVGEGDVGLRRLEALQNTLSAPLPAAVTALVDAALTAHLHTGPLGQEAVLVVDDGVMQQALATFRDHDPRGVMGDLTGRLMTALDDAAAHKKGSGHAVLVMADGGGFRVSVRGSGALEVQKAISSQGGGKPGAAVAVIDAGTDVAEVVARCKRALRDQSLRACAQLRLSR